MTVIESENLPLAHIYHWERMRTQETYLVQPIGNGDIRSFTWGQAVGEVRRMAAHLRSLDLPRGSNIGILSKNCAHWLLADFAIWMSGHVSVPLYPNLTVNSVREILDHSEVRVLFVGKLDHWGTLQAGVPTGIRCIGFPDLASDVFAGPQWEDIVRDTAPITEEVERGAGELATIIYTSGTMGEPKGVMHTFAALAWGPSPLLDLMSFGPNDRMISYLPLSHVAERICVEMLSVQTGFPVYFTESIETFGADLQRARPTFFIAVPRIWIKLQQRMADRLPSGPIPDELKLAVLQALGLHQVRLAVSGAAALEPELMLWYRNLGLELTEGYGMSEVCGFSHIGRPGKLREGYVGAPLRGVECRLSETGEIQLRSAGNTIGYYKRAEVPPELITEDGFVRTGDKGEMDREGRLKITGRVKEIFKTSKGKYVAPARIESFIGVHPYVEVCCVVGQGLAQPCALVSLSGEGRHLVRNGRRDTLTTSLIEHLEHVNQRLDRHEKVHCMVIVDSIWNEESGLVTPTFKVRRANIEDRYESHLAEWQSRNVPIVWEADQG